MPGDPFKPSFGLSGIMALDVPLPDCHTHYKGNKSSQNMPGSPTRGGPGRSSHAVSLTPEVLPLGPAETFSAASKAHTYPRANFSPRLLGPAIRRAAIFPPGYFVKMPWS